MASETGGEYLHSFGLDEPYCQSLTKIYTFTRTDRGTTERPLKDTISDGTIPFDHDYDSRFVKAAEIYKKSTETLESYYDRNEVTGELSLTLYRIDSDDEVIDAIKFSAPHEFQPLWQVEMAGTLCGVTYYPGDPRPNFDEVMHRAKALIEDCAEILAILEDGRDKIKLRAYLSSASQATAREIEEWLADYALQNGMLSPEQPGGRVSIRRSFADESDAVLTLHFYFSNGTTRIGMRLLSKKEDDATNYNFSLMDMEKLPDGQWHGHGEVVADNVYLNIEDEQIDPNLVIQAHDNIISKVRTCLDSY